MTVNFSKIHIENFLSFDSADIELTDKGFVRVVGVNKNITDNAVSNGAGKSTIWDAISWVLTGETVRGDNKHIENIYTSGGTYVELVFMVDKKEYRITRTKNHSVLGTDLKIFIDGEDKSGKGIRDGEKLLKEYLPDITSLLLGSVIILGQGLPQRFSNNSPVGRKEVLEKLCKSDFMIADLKERIGGRKSTLDSQLLSFSNTKIEKETELRLKTNSLASNKAYLESLVPVNQEKLNSLELSIKSIEKAVVDTQQELDSIDTKIASSKDALRDLEVESSKSEVSIKESHKEELDSLNNECNSLVNDIKFLENTIKQKESITDICPTCGQKISGVEKPDTQQDHIRLWELSEKLTEIDNRRKLVSNSINQEIQINSSNFEAKKTVLKDSIDSLVVDRGLISNKIKELNNSLITNKRELETLERMQFAFNSDKARVENTIATEELEIKNLTFFISELADKIEALSSHLDVVSKFNTYITRDFRGHLLYSIIEYINKYAKVYSNDIFGNDLINIYLDGNNLNIDYSNKSYECLSGGEKQKVDLIIQFAIRDVLCKMFNFSCNIIVLDELFDNLDAQGCDKVISTISERLQDISSIFIITHHTELQLPFDTTLMVEKNKDGISRANYV